MRALSAITLNFAGTTTQSFWVQNIHGSHGSPGFTISGSGYQDTSTYVSLAPSGFAFAQASATQKFSINPTQYEIQPNVLVSGVTAGPQILRPGATASLYIANLNGVGRVANPVTINGGSASTSAAFTPWGIGTDVLCIDQPAGYLESTNLNEITITVPPR